MHQTSPFDLLRPRWLGLVNTWQKAEPRTRWTWSLFGVMGFLFWFGMFLGLWWVLGRFFGVEVFGPLLTRKLLEILLLGLFTMMVFSNVVTCLSTFYLSEDLELLRSLPVGPATLHYNRLLETLFQSSWMMAMFGLPVFGAYGLVYHASPLYYALVLLVIPSFLLFPLNFGVVVSSVLVNVFPARRTREFLAVFSIVVVVGLFMLLRWLRPERLVDAQAFESLAAYVAALQAPVPTWLPPRWATDVLLAALQDRPIPWISLGLLVSGAAAFTAFGRWLASPLHASGWARSQEARSARGARSWWLRGLLVPVSAVVPSRMLPFVIKDIRIFFRDPAQWSQVILLGALIVIYLFSVQVFPLDQLRGPWIQFWRTSFAFMNLGMTGFVMAGVAVRFQFTAVSAEGRAFWVPRTSPVAARDFLWAKSLVGLGPTLVVGETLAVLSSVLLEADVAFTVAAGATALALAFGINGLATGMGAAWPDFKADNASRAAASPAGVLFMVAALLLVGTVLLLEGLPLTLWIRATANQAPLEPLHWLGIVAPLVAALALCAFFAIWPVRKAAHRLWNRETV